MKQRMTRSLTALLMAAVMLLGMSLSTYAPAVSVSAATRSELEAQLNNLKQKEKKIKNDIANASNDLSASKRRKELLEDQIDNARQQIELLDKQLSSVQSGIAKKNKQIKQTEQEIQETDDTIKDIRQRLGKRLRVIEKTGNTSFLQRLLNTDSYTDYLLKSKVSQCFAEQDSAAMDDLNDTLDNLEQKKAKLQKQKKEIESEKKELQRLQAESNSKRKELETLHSAVQTEIRKLQSDVSDYNSDLAETRKKIEAADRAIEALIKNTASVGRYNAKMMHWPVPTVRAISSHYGPRWGTMHRGLDIANGSVPIYGQNIVAAADGVVIAVNSTSWYGSGWSYGYGYCVIIDHGVDNQGRTIHTMYAHCSAMYARVGQKVTGGKTVIARAGNSGDVTGPHLHFEVRVNGDRVNPYPNYVHPNVN